LAITAKNVADGATPFAAQNGMSTRPAAVVAAALQPTTKLTASNSHAERASLPDITSHQRST
jgi:hypothetical protein